MTLAMPSVHRRVRLRGGHDIVRLLRRYRALDNLQVAGREGMLDVFLLSTARRTRGH